MLRRAQRAPGPTISRSSRFCGPGTFWLLQIVSREDGDNLFARIVSFDSATGSLAVETLAGTGTAMSSRTPRPRPVQKKYGICVSLGLIANPEDRTGDRRA